MNIQATIILQQPGTLPLFIPCICGIPNYFRMLRIQLRHHRRERKYVEVGTLLSMSLSGTAGHGTNPCKRTVRLFLARQQKAGTFVRKEFLYITAIPCEAAPETSETTGRMEYRIQCVHRTRRVVPDDIQHEHKQRERSL